MSLSCRVDAFDSSAAILRPDGTATQNQHSLRPQFEMASALRAKSGISHPHSEQAGPTRLICDTLPAVEQFSTPVANSPLPPTAERPAA